MTATSASFEGTGATRIDPDTTLGTVRLTVSDLDRARTFYERVTGLRTIERDDGTLALGVADNASLIELRGDTKAPPSGAADPFQSAPRLDRRAPGLYHLAILVPTRRDLAFALARLAVTRWPLDGASDHLVSEALYLSDPDGNGIEIYRDRPRAEWPHADGRLQMATMPLDLDDVLAELPAAPELQPHAPPGTRIGHVHLQVAELAAAEAFYHDVLGFDVMVRGYPGALFVSAGGYHHHIGLNTWHSAGVKPAAAGAVGLRSFTIELPDQAGLDAVVARIDAAGLPHEIRPDGILVRDPFEIAVILTTRTSR